MIGDCMMHVEPQKEHRCRPAVGILLMIVASLVVPLVDGIAKTLGARHSPFFVAWVRYATASLIVVPLTLLRSRGVHARRDDFASNALRTALIVGAMTSFFFAITDIPLAMAFGGYFLGPIIAAFLAAPLLGEKITQARLGAGVLSLVGAYLIVRPGLSLRVGSLLAVVSGVLFAGYLIATRIAATTTPPMDALRFQCVFGTLLLTPVAVSHWSWPTQRDMLLIALMGGLSATCHLMVIAAFRHSEASILSPLAYLELVTATLLGSFVFAELPDALASLGIACIILSGLIIWLAQHLSEQIESRVIGPGPGSDGCD
jgi:drug/metabolite transporter (DMT)-like permease